MLDQTINGIAQKLNQVFGDGYEIYIDQVEQGLSEPCFLIVCVDGGQEQGMGTLYLREQAFDILYFPYSSKQLTREINGVIGLLYTELEYITVDGNPVRGTEMKHEVVDGVLHFFVHYDIRIRKVVEPDPFMETLIERVKPSGD
jgi:hypothetical protein